MQVDIDYLGEGLVDEVIARRLIVHCGGQPSISYLRPRRGTGKQSLDSRIAGLNAGVRYGRPVLVLRDLDTDAECPKALLDRLLPTPNFGMLLRICVRSVEAWLSADKLAFASYCGVPRTWLPAKPEEAVDLKNTIVSWSDRNGAKAIRKHFVETRRRGVPDWASIGEWQAIFAQRHWDIDRATASGAAPSLVRAVARVEELVRRQAVQASESKQ